MMKKIFISFGFLMMSILPVFAQNSHWEYQNQTNIATSAVTVVHSNGTAYLFQSNGSEVFVQELDPYTMIPFPLNSNNATLLPIGPLFLKGGYEDFNGNIVIYGNLGLNPMAARYDVSTQQIINVFINTNYTYDCFCNGCCGYDVHGIMVDVFVLENQGILIGTDWAGNDYSSMVTNNSGHFSDILWDSFNSCFAATGYQFNVAGPQLFLVGMDYDVTSGLSPAANKSLAWCLSNTVFSFAEYETCMEILPTGDFVVGVSVRDGQHDWIWLTTTNGYIGTHNSAVFQMSSPKMLVQDMKYNDDMGWFFILGKINHSCGSIHYLAQVDPYSLSGMVAAYLTGNMPLNTCLFNPSTLGSNAIALQKLEVNPFPFVKILATGTYANSEVYVTETYDIANSSCDLIFYPTDVHYPLTIWNVLCAPLNTTLSLLPAPSFSYMLYTTEYWSCQDPMKQNFPKLTILSPDSTVVEYKGDGLMDFIGFSGEIIYKVYNMMGKCVAVGNAVNSTERLHMPSNGLYIIKAEDKYGHAATTKFVQVSK